MIRVEGQTAREQFVQNDADRIEIAAVVDRIAPDHFRADVRPASPWRRSDLCR